jgi:predicted permease
MRRSARQLAQLSAIAGAEFTLTGAGEPERLSGARVSSSFFGMVGIGPALGRGFTQDEDVPGRNRVVIISHDLWRARFGGDPSIVGRPVSLNGGSYVVIGVMPEGFLFPMGRQLHQYVPLGPRVDVWTPMAFSKDEIESEGSWNYGVIARLNPGVKPAAAQEELNAIARAVSERVRVQTKGADIDIGFRLGPLRDVFSGNVRRELLLLMAAVALLLLIAGVNLANLLAARASSRMRELATRAAIGASRGRLLRQVVTESALLALCGAAVAIVTAYWSLQVLGSLAPPDVQVAIASSGLSAPVLLFTVGAALASGVIVGLVPALEIGRRDVFHDLRDGSRAATSARGTRSGQALVAIETALTCGLAIVAALLLHSFYNVLQVDKGFRADRVLAVDVSLPGSYSTAQSDIFYQQLLERVGTLPGVQSTGAVNVLPLVDESMTRLIRLETDADYHHDVDRPVAVYRVATPGYFSTLGVPIRAGRIFQAQEPQPVAVISAGLAQRLWPGKSTASVVGRHVRAGDLDSPLLTVVGVVADVRSGALDREPMPAIYRPQRNSGFSRLTVVARTVGDPAALPAAVRAEIGRLDRNLPVGAMRTLDDVVLASVGTRRFQAMLVTLFAMLALALAVVGVYGVTSYAVTRQAREIGVRIALGARPTRVVTSVLSRGLRPVAIGLVAGLALAASGGRVIGTFLYGVGPTDPAAFAIATGVLLVAAAIACYLPARRAAAVDPVAVLRLE